MMPPSNMVHTFSQVPHADIPRSSFDRTSNYKTTFDAGYLIPFFCDEVLPGDTFSLNMTGFARLATPIKPLMDNVFMNTFFFFVPNRLLWDNWERFNGAQSNPLDSTDYLVPEILAKDGEMPNGSIYDYFGLPTGALGTGTLHFNALHFRAYNLIWNEWMRDQNLQDSVPIHTDDGPDPIADYKLLRRGKRHDYFTSALPWPQKGDSVTLPLGTSAPVRPDPLGIPYFAVDGLNRSIAVGVGDTTMNVTAPAPVSANNTVRWGTGGAAATGLEADLSNATAATINQLRQAFAVQRLYERDARGGTRYTEIVRSHFGVVSPDARLQRPEYLGGGQSPVVVHPVAQTQSSGDDTAPAATPQGNLAGYGTSVLSGHGFSKGFTEHGVIIGLVSVRADLNYQQGLNRMWSRRGRFDFYWPALSHIGEQAVLMKEIYAEANPATDDLVWGYQERFAEYRYKPSIITGQFRSNYAQSLDVWHLALDFSTRPNLNATFIQDDPPIARVIAVPSEPHFIGDFYFRLRCARPMPVYGVPGLIDHF